KRERWLKDGPEVVQDGVGSDRVTRPSWCRTKPQPRPAVDVQECAVFRASHPINLIGHDEEVLTFLKCGSERGRAGGLHRGENNSRLRRIALPRPGAKEVLITPARVAASTEEDPRGEVWQRLANLSLPLGEKEVAWHENERHFTATKGVSNC